MRNQIYKDNEINDEAIEQFIDTSIKYFEALETKQAFKSVEKFIIANYSQTAGHIFIKGHCFKVSKMFGNQTLTYIGEE